MKARTSSNFSIDERRILYILSIGLANVIANALILYMPADTNHISIITLLHLITVQKIISLIIDLRYFLTTFHLQVKLKAFYLLIKIYDKLYIIYVNSSLEQDHQCLYSSF